MSVKHSRITDNKQTGIGVGEGSLTLHDSLVARNHRGISVRRPSGSGFLDVYRSTIRDNDGVAMFFLMHSLVTGDNHIHDSNVTRNNGPALYMYSGLDVPASSVPHRRGNNIYDNRLDSTDLSPTQFDIPRYRSGFQDWYPGIPGAVDWTGNFWGATVEYFPNEPECGDVGKFGGLRHASGRYPIKRDVSTVWSADHSHTIQCPHDHITIGSSQLSHEYLDNGAHDDYSGDPLSTTLTGRFKPAFLYDSLEQYRVLSPVALAEFYDETSFERDESNAIYDDLGRFGIADPRQAGQAPDNLSHLSQYFVGATYQGGPPVGGRRESSSAQSSDYIGARAEIISISPVEEDHSSYIPDSRAREPLDGNQIFGHVARGSDGRIWVQYWLFYYFNPLVPGHEGDWEMVQYGLNNATLEPETAAYAQHGDGQWCAWNNITRAGNQPHVYVARDSHASYFGLNRTGGRDHADGGHPDSLLNADLEEVTETDPSWMAWPGHWGDTDGGADSPYGPSKGDHAGKWNDPGAWASSLSECPPA